MFGIERLAALDQLDKIRRVSGQSSSDANNVIHWLDLVTSETSAQSARICLQGVNESYSNWGEVEKSLICKNSLLEEVQEHNVDKLENEVSSKLNIHESSDMNSIASSCSIGVRSKSPSSPRSLYSSTSASLMLSSPCNEDKAISASKPRAQQIACSHKAQEQCIPLPLQTFFNHAVWRMNHMSRENSISPYIILTNDPKKTEAASCFGFRVMHVEQLRKLLVLEQGNSDSVEGNSQKENEAALNDMEEVVVLKRNPRDKNRMAPKISDLKQFERQLQSIRGRGRGHGRQRGATRGSAKGRGGSVFNVTAQTISKPIDPDSFIRTSPNTRRGFGGRKKLWEPS